MQEASPQKPYDSKITIGLGDRAEDVVTIPPMGIFQPALVPSLFFIVWLGGWAVGVVFASWSLVNPSTPLEARIFLLFWLAFWMLGGIVAIKTLFSMLVGMLGYEKISFGFDNITHRRGVFGYTKTWSYPTEKIIKFERTPHSAGEYAGQALASAGCLMHFGKRTIPVGLGVKGAEADWLAAELNRLLERYRR